MRRNKPRYPKGSISSFAINFIQMRNPYIIAWWSMALPGFGHITQGRFILGVFLITWEFYANIHSNLNEAIFYSLTGQFEAAKAVINLRVYLLYLPIYLMAIWDSFKITIEINQLTILSEREGAYISPPLTFSDLEVNYLAKKNPLMAVFWTLFAPGLGHMYLKRMMMGFFILFIFIINVYYSKALLAFHLLVRGNFAAATRVVDKEWFLFFPSLYAFSIYDAYKNATEYIKLFKTEQKRYLEAEYPFTRNDFELLWEKV
jgi:hypothetical protein